MANDICLEYRAGRGAKRKRMGTQKCGNAEVGFSRKLRKAFVHCIGSPKSKRAVPCETTLFSF